jgi:hypothetical protein
MAIVGRKPHLNFMLPYNNQKDLLYEAPSLILVINL